MSSLRWQESTAQAATVHPGHRLSALPPSQASSFLGTTAVVRRAIRAATASTGPLPRTRRATPATATWPRTCFPRTATASTTGSPYVVSLGRGLLYSSFPGPLKIWVEKFKKQVYRIATPYWHRANRINLDSCSFPQEE